MTRRRKIGIAAALLLLVAALILMPMRIVFGGNGMSARKVEGLIWNGAARDLRVGQLSIGDVNVRLHALPLLLARAKFSLSRGDAPFAPGVSGSITRRCGQRVGGWDKGDACCRRVACPAPCRQYRVAGFLCPLQVGPLRGCGWQCPDDRREQCSGP